MSLEIRNCPDLRFINISISADQNVCEFRNSSPSLQVLWCGVEVLPPVLPAWTCIEELIVLNCPNLISITVRIKLYSLSLLKIENCPNLESISVLASLQRLVVSSCGDEKLPMWLYSCEEFIILNCPNLIGGDWGELHSCTKFVIDNCRRVENLPDRLESCKELIISNCPNMRRCNFGELHSLTKLEIENCPRLRYFGGIPKATSRLVISSCAVEDLPIELQSCTSLEELEISDCPKLIRIPDLGEDLFSLKELHVTNCPNLISLGSIQGAAYLHRLTFGVDPLPIGLESCQFIQYLQICGCPNLISFPDLGGVHYLKELKIRLCPRLTSFLSLQDAMSLKRLVITFCESLEALSNGLQSCRDLEELTIWNCYNLESIPDLRGLLSLTKLSIKNCRRCTSVSLPDGLKTLVIGPFSEELQSFPTLISYAYFQNSLERLELCGWAILNSLPEEIQRFNAVRFLCINEFDGILALPEWLGNLSSLRSLTVVNCENLMDFPTAEAMGRLTELEILYCPALQERCAEETGTEWYKIAHIPIIQIDGEYIRGEGYDI